MGPAIRIIRIATVFRVVLVAASIVVMSACTTNLPIEGPSQAQSKRVLQPPKSLGDVSTLPAPAPLLELSPEMKAFAQTYAPMSSPARRRLERLFEAVKFHPTIQTEYDARATLTAQEVFETQRGNCLSFSSMFIALARQVGLPAYFQEVDVPPTWEQVSANTLAQYRHVNVVVPFPGSDRIIDFRIDRYKETYTKRRLTDSQALAHYHSNIGMEKLVEGDYSGAFWNMKLAIESAPEHPYFWTNMGIIQRRLGDDELAEISYRKALALDNGNYSAMGNLAILYEEQHKNDLAEQLRRLSDQSRLSNPYYRYALAQNSYRIGDYEEALQQLNYAVRRRANEHRFHFLRGLSLRALGRPDAAVNSVKRAIKLTDGDYEESTVERYQSQLDEWLEASG